MAPRHRRLSGADVIDIFERFGFVVHSQKGSHVKLRRVILTTSQTLVIPKHDQPAPGTINAIFNQACAFVPQERLMPLFFFE